MSEIASRQLPDGRLLEIVPLTFRRARIVIGQGDGWYEDQW